MLNEKQTQALNIAEYGHNVLVTGQGGTGKSFLIKEIAKALTENMVTFQITCSTGIACTLYPNAQTLHSWAGILDGRYSESQITELILNDEKYKNTLNRIQSTDCLIIDELSMISKGTFEKIEYICRNVIGNDIIFGGIQVIGSGDFLQLSPVPNILYGDFGHLCIESQVFQKTFPHHINLTEVMRQDEADLICAVSELEKGELSTETIELMTSLSRPLSKDQHPIYLYARNFYVDLHNYEIMSNMPGEFVIYQSTDTGSLHYLSRMTTQARLALKTGCRVMLLKNIENKLFNGMIGTVVELNTASIVVNFNGQVCKITAHLFTVYDPVSKQVLAKRLQYPLKPCYAMTIHKSQGMTLESVVVNCSNASIPGQIGVAVGRVTFKKGLQVLNFHPSLVKKHPPVVTVFYNSPSQEPDEILSCCKRAMLNESLVKDIFEDFELENPLETGVDIPPYNITEIDFLNILEHEVEEPEEEINIDSLHLLTLAHRTFFDTPVENEIVDCYNKFTSCMKELGEWVNKVYKVIEDFSKTHLQTPAQKNITAFCADINKHLQNPDYLHTCNTLLKTYFVNPSNVHHSLLTAVVFEIQRDILSKHREVVNTNVSQNTSQTLHTRKEPSSSGLGKIRYIGGYCVAKLKAEVTKKMSSCMYVPQKKNEFNNCKITFNLLEKMASDYNVVKGTTKYPETLEETQRKQNVAGGLTNITDQAYEFFVLLEKISRNEQNDSNLAQYGSLLFEHIYSVIVSSEKLEQFWYKIFETVDKTPETIMTELMEKTVKKFLNVSAAQFTKDFKMQVKREKSTAHRKKVMEKSKAAKISKLSYSDILQDKSSNKEITHMKLKLMVNENPDIFMDKAFTKQQLQQLAKSYDLNVLTKCTKKDLGKLLCDTINSSDSLPLPHILTVCSQVAAVTETEDSVTIEPTPGPSSVPETPSFEPTSERSCSGPSSEIGTEEPELPSVQNVSKVKSRPVTKGKRKGFTGTKKGKGKAKSMKKKRKDDTCTENCCSLCFQHENENIRYIQCDTCDGWFCEECSDISDWEHYEEEGVQYLCRLCKL